MKKLLQFLVCTFFFIQISSAQVYRPFLVDSAHWIVTENACINGPCDPGNPSPSDCFTNNTYSYKLSGDTVINGFTYKILTQNIFYSAQSALGYCNYPYNRSWSPCATVGLLWEDTIARKVYIKRTNIPMSCAHFTDSLLFDFSMLVGDTMRFPGACIVRPGSTTMDIDDLYIVDSINYSGFNSGYPRYHQYSCKTWYMHVVLDSGYMATAPMLLYESIGSSFGFFGYQPPFEGPYGTKLSSYDIGSDSSTGFSCIDPLLSIPDVSAQTVLISLYPNPAKDILTIQLNDITPDKILQFELLDILGQEIHMETLNKTKSEVDISTLPAGIYIWHLVSDGNMIQSGKLVHE